MESILPLLPALACPVGMGLMMWLMMRGGNKSQVADTAMGNQRIAVQSNADNSGGLADLQAQLRAIELEQASLTAQLTQLESAGEVRAPGR